MVRFEELIRDRILQVGDGYRAKNDELGGDGPIFLRAAYLQDHGFVLASPERFNATAPSNFGAKAAEHNDVVITTKGNSIGRVGRIREAQVGAIYSPHLSYWRSRNAQKLDQTFLYYWSKSKEFREQLLGMAASTDMAPYLSLRDQLRLRISLPSIERQQTIGETLGVLDDKIDLNRRVNETLEAMARALFKDWFVDFGPTSAKMEGRASYFAPETWALFPDRLDDDGKPLGWGTGTLEDYADLNSESWTRGTYPDRVNYVDLSSTKWGAIEAIGTYTRSDAPSRAQRILRPGDSIVGIVRPGNGSYAFISSQDLTGSTGFAVLRPRKQIACEFVYLAATAPENIDRLAYLADGAAYPAVRPEVVAATEAVIAAPSVLSAFSAVTKALINRIEANKVEASVLADTRDFLLPRLMSGEIRVNDAEKHLAAVA